MRALKGVDQVILSIDEDPPVTETLEMIARQYPGCQLVFAMVVIDRAGSCSRA